MPRTGSQDTRTIQITCAVPLYYVRHPTYVNLRHFTCFARIPLWWENCTLHASIMHPACPSLHTWPAIPPLSLDGTPQAHPPNPHKGNLSIRPGKVLDQPA